MASSAHILTSGSRTGALSRGHGPEKALKRWWNAFWAAKARRTTVSLLQGLDDRTLQDIGVERSEIESLVYSKSGERLRRYQPQWK
jgi:uncharacterized protein YjiS (DUF1127 family)